MAVKTIAGPFKTHQEARETAQALGNQYSPFSRYINDAEGYIADECMYYVECDDAIVSNKISATKLQSF